MSGDAAPVSVSPRRPPLGVLASARRRGFAIREEPARYTSTPAAPAPLAAPHGLAEHELTALWLLGRMPADVLPWPLLRPGRAGQGPGPDVREATFVLPSGVVRSGAVEVHLRASDFVRHGHGTDSAYAAVVAHLVWEDDRTAPSRGGGSPPTGSSRGGGSPPTGSSRDGGSPPTGSSRDGGSPPTDLTRGGGSPPTDLTRGGGSPPTVLPGGGLAVTIAVGPALGYDPARLRALLRRGPSGGEPCAVAASGGGVTGGTAVANTTAATTAAVRREGQRRLAERVWRAARLVDERGWELGWAELLERALRASAGRCRESDGRREALAARVTLALGPDTLGGLAGLAAAAGSRDGPRVLIDALRAGDALGRARAAEVGWNAALPLLAALAAAYDDVALAGRVAALAAAWPAPRPYGRTRALAALLGRPAPGAGALYAQGLLHTQELWCERGGCGVCPLSAQSTPSASASAHAAVEGAVPGARLEGGPPGHP